MKYTISKNVLEKFPTASLGIIAVRGINNSKSTPDILKRLRDSESGIRHKFEAIKPTDHPRIKCWRETYSAFGAKPSKYNCSIEAMAKRILEGGSIPDINDLVNLYNSLSLSRLISVGGDDSDKINGDVMLDIANGHEKFMEMGQNGIKSPNAGEIIFKDDNGVLGRRWNWRQSEKTKITKNSANANLQIEGVYPVTKKDIEEAGEELMQLLNEFFGANASFHYADKNNPSAEI